MLMNCRQQIRMGSRFFFFPPSLDPKNIQRVYRNNKTQSCTLNTLILATNQYFICVISIELKFAKAFSCGRLFYAVVCVFSHSQNHIRKRIQKFDKILFISLMQCDALF